ncbi:hypothetical protein DMN91_001192 [Ooceraea biroi]|uniref:Uncharacterized protein n=1 Tax=Ooceraea biroi TaxID=2015173 RepID=A0A3L8E3R6_OOCBI|nr:hypothetical protein DMN91_001142 [Ooceraea biroi]RLU27388.1 hypothetical protein DMN91_001192 [Ooceraea biroi]
MQDPRRREAIVEMEIVAYRYQEIFQSGIPSSNDSFPCSKQCVPKAPYHSPVRCRVVRRLDGELIRARGSQNHRGTGYVTFSLPVEHLKRKSDYLTWKSEICDFCLMIDSYLNSIKEHLL